MRHPLPAEFLRLRQRDPARIHHLAVCFGEARRGGDAAIGVTGAAFPVRHSVERRDHISAEPPRLAQHSGQRIGIERLERGQMADGFNIQHLFDHKQGIAQRGGPFSHAGFPVRLRVSPSSLR